jgi:hypothetical protein
MVGERSALRTYRFTLEGKKAPYILDAGWAPETVWMLWRRENISTSARNQFPYHHTK